MKRKTMRSFLYVTTAAISLTGCGQSSSSFEVTTNSSDSISSVTSSSVAESTVESSVTEEKHTYTINYMLNDGTDELYETETVKGKPSVAYINATPGNPTREGYRFAGWHTKADVSKSDLIHGVSPYEWKFGKNLSGTGQGYVAKMDEEEIKTREIESMTMKISSYAVEDTLTLYARWVEKTEVTTADELQAMRDDLYGWYSLASDIDLSGYAWESIGAYFSNYEFYNSVWWSYGFRGKIDGNHHTISNLSLSSASYEKNYKEDENAVWFKDGNTCNGNVAMISAAASAEFSDLTLDNFNLDVNYAGDFLYAGTLCAFDMGSLLKNVEAKDFHVTVVSEDTNQVFRDNLFVTVGGLEAGSWSTTVISCSAQGNVNVTTTNKKSHGGEIYVGGLFGENYAACYDVHVNTDVSLTHQDEGTDEEDLLLSVNVGGLGGASVGVNPIDADDDDVYSEEEIQKSKSTVEGKVNVNLSKPKGESIVNVGGVSGSQRYDLVAYTDINEELTLSTDLDSEKGVLNCAAISGRIDVYYLLQILSYANENFAGEKENNASVTLNGEALNEAIHYLPDGLVKATYEDVEYDAIVYGAEIAEQYNTTENFNAIYNQYGANVSRGSMSKGIIFILH